MDGTYDSDEELKLSTSLLYKRGRAEGICGMEGGTGEEKAIGIDGTNGRMRNGMSPTLWHPIFALYIPALFRRGNLLRGEYNK